MTNPHGTPQGSSLHQALQNGLAQLEKIEPQTSTTRSLVRQLRRLQKEHSPQIALDSIEDIQRDLRHMLLTVDEIHQAGLVAEYKEAQKKPYERAWRDRRQRELKRFEKPDDWAEHWIESWTEVLAHGKYSDAALIVEWRHPYSTEEESDAVRDDMRSLTRELKARQHPTMRALDGLLRWPHLSHVSRVRLSVLKARTLMQHHGNPHEATALLRNAAGLAKETDFATQALVQAARAEIALAEGALTEAKRHVRGVLLSDEEIPDRVIVAGQIALAEQAWPRASTLFTAVASRWPRTAETSRLLSGVPPNLLLAVARSLRAHDPSGAERRYGRAIRAGIIGRVSKRRALIEHAELLAELGRNDEAAKEYADAVELYRNPRNQELLEISERAYQLDPHKPRYCWLLGEQLRLRATDIDGITNPNQIRRARELLDLGTQQARAEDVPGWVMVSTGLAAHFDSLDRVESDRDPLLWLERGILREREDTKKANDFALLAWLYRLSGFAQAAERAARFGAGYGPVDSFLAEQWIRALLDLEQYDEASNVLKNHKTTITPIATAIWRGWIACRRGDPSAGINALNGQDGGSPFVAVVRMACYELMRDEHRARIEARQILQDQDNLPDEWVGWAEFALDRTRESIDRLDKLHRRAQDGHIGGLRLGLALLVRGSSADRDVERAHEILSHTIAHSYLADDLIQLRQIYLDQTTGRLTGTPHELAGRDVLEKARVAAEQRISELQRRKPDADLLSQRLATARELRAKDDWRALETYADLANTAELPEVSIALEEIAAYLISSGDEQLARGNLGAAYRIWADIQSNLGSTNLATPVPDRLAARLGLSRLLWGSPDDAYLGAVSAQALEEAVPHFANTLDLARRYDKALQASADRATVDSQSKFRQAAAAVPFASLLGMKVTDRMSRAFSPSARACEILFDRSYADLKDSPELSDQIASLREDFRRTSGLAIPGVRLAENTRSSNAMVTFRVFEQEVNQLRLSAEDDPVLSIMEQFRKIVADNLFRWIAVDDLGLWNADWTFEGQPLTELPEDLVDRVRLTRVLRLLLSEGVPIADRCAIVGGFQAGVERGPANEAVPIMTAVRRRLYPAITASGSDQEILPLPPDLEETIGSALNARRATMPRDGARKIRESLLRWKEEAWPDREVTISVADTALRPAVWHLLSAERPRVFVVAQAELPIVEAEL